MFADMLVYRKRYLGSRDGIVALKKDGKLEEADQLLQQHFIPDGKAYLEALRGLLDLQRKRIDNNAAGIEATYQHSRDIMLVLGLGVLALGAACAWWLTRGIVVPLGRAVEIAAAVAGKDLRSDIEVDTGYETGRLLQALKTMNDGLVEIVAEVRTGTESIASASSQIASGNLDLSTRIEQQASSLEETASSMEEMTSTVKQNADNARQANQMAISASEVALKGGAVVLQVVDTMESISASSKKIVDIIAVIDGIAFQTNILALNPAADAARAGEQGRGVAVVASEVRNLAQRSAAAAKEIKALISDAVVQVETGSRLVGQAGSTMDDVVASVQRVTAIIGEIAVASGEQNVGIDQVNTAIAHMDGVTQQNAALVEQAAAAADAMQQQAVSLAQAVSVFKINGSYGGALQALAPAPRVPVSSGAARPASSATARIPADRKSV